MDSEISYLKVWSCYIQNAVVLPTCVSIKRIYIGYSKLCMQDHTHKGRLFSQQQYTQEHEALCSKILANKCLQNALGTFTNKCLVHLTFLNEKANSEEGERLASSALW